MTERPLPDLRVRHIPPAHWWEPVRWELLDGVIFGGIAAPAGFQFDGASVPRWLWWLWPPMGRYALAALIHDWLYAHGEVTRAEADGRFLQAMDSLRMPPWRSYPLYWAVRLGGWAAWRRRREDG